MGIARWSLLDQSVLPLAMYKFLVFLTRVFPRCLDSILDRMAGWVFTNSRVSWPWASNTAKQDLGYNLCQYSLYLASGLDLAHNL
jgi:hypothetical protein